MVKDIDEIYKAIEASTTFKHLLVCTKMISNMSNMLDIETRSDLFDKIDEKLDLIESNRNVVAKSGQ